MLAQIKLDIIEKITHLNDEKTLEYIHKLVDDAGSIEPISLDEFNQQINSALDDSQKDRVKKATHLQKELKNWN